MITIKYFPVTILACCFLVAAFAAVGCSAGAPLTSTLLAADLTGVWSGERLFDGIDRGTMEMTVRSNGTFSCTCPGLNLGHVATGTISTNGDILIKFCFSSGNNNPFSASGKLNLTTPGRASGILDTFNSNDGTNIGTFEISLQKQ